MGHFATKNDGQLRKDGFVNDQGNFIWNFEYLFDTEGKEIGYTYIDLQSGERFPYLYEYTKENEEGEWTERQVLENGNVKSIETRSWKGK